MVSRNLGFRFNLVSYNILSQTLLNNHSYLYNDCDPKDLEWPKRGHKIVTELLDIRADIICLQEVECEHLNSLYRPKLARHGYKCLYKKKTGYQIDGCAIFYKSKLFQLLNHKGVEFNRRDVTSLLNRDNVGIIAVLKPKFQSKSESKQLVVANTHLIFNPMRSDVRLAQLKLFLSELEEMSLEYYDKIKDERYHHPTILCGDLNSIPESGVVEYLLKNVNQSLQDKSNDKKDETSTVRIEVNNRDQADVQRANTEDDHNFKFKSVYPVKNRKGQPYVTTFSQSIVDYIFYTPKLHLESYRELLTEEQLKASGPMPSSEFSSDHISLEANFTIR